MWSFRDCRTEARKKQIGWVRGLFICTPVGIDRALRLRDFRFNRSFGGRLARFGIQGQPPLAVLLPAAVLFWMVYGPTGGWRGFEALIVFVASLLVLLIGARFTKAIWMPEFQILEIAIVATIVWKRGQPFSEFNPDLYPHALIMIFLVLIAIPVLLSHLLAIRLCADLRRRYGPLLRMLVENVELFVIPEYPDISWAAIGRSFINAPLRYPLHLLFAPAVVVLFTPFWWRDWLGSWAVVSLVITWLFLSAAALHPRLDALLRLSTRTLFIGGQLLVSLVIIVFALARLLDVSYVVTVIESASVWLVLSYALAAYTIFWFYEYWTNAVLTEQLVGLLQRHGDVAGQATYDLEPQVPCTRVKRKGRAIQVQSGARLIVIGPLPNGEGEAFQTYEKSEFFDRLAEDAPPGLVQGLDRAGLRDAVREITDRVWFYFGVLNIVVLAIAVGGMVGLSRLWQVPELSIEKPTTHASVDLRHVLFDADASGGPRKQAILLAASGGGTRAALYTASVLHGLYAEHVLDDVVLASGVSGGGAALAYFAGYRDQLLAPNNEAVWRHYECVMSQPFIQDVLFGIAEWRLLAGTRWGTLLAESFNHRFGLGPYGTATSTEVGLIFNTSLAGHLACDLPQRCASDQWGKYTQETWRTEADVAGGRLILTNLDHDDAFPGLTLPEAPEQHLTYTVVTDNVSITTAAALNANFPPVFANAAVDRYYRDRYWVTDGGAVDNRGIESLLFALRDALQRQKRQSGAQHIQLPRIHIIVADASASTIDYQQDRGVGSALGAAEKFASQLMTELVQQIRSLWTELRGEPANLQFHYLAMPTTLRIRGGIGTHWMMPRFVKLTDPNRDCRHPDLVTVDNATVRALIDRLHQTQPTPPSAPPCRCDEEDDLLQKLANVFEGPSSQDLTKVQGWIDRDQHHDRWLALTRELRHK
jgi:hypothetical protein